MALTLVDNDAAGPTDVRLAVSPSSFTEGGGAISFTVTATQGSGTAAANVDVQISIDSSSTATQNTDYVAGTLPTLQIPMGGSSAESTFILTPTEDSAIEGSEVIVLTASVAGYTVVPPLPSITLLDNEAPAAAATAKLRQDADCYTA